MLFSRLHFTWYLLVKECVIESKITYTLFALKTISILLKHQHSMYQIWRFGHEFRSIFFRSKAQIKCYNNRKIIVQGQFKIRSKVYIDIWLIARIEMKKKKKLLEILVLYISLDGYIEIFMTSVWIRKRALDQRNFDQLQ